MHIPAKFAFKYFKITNEPFKSKLGWNLLWGVLCTMYILCLSDIQDDKFNIGTHRPWGKYFKIILIRNQ